jgi:hypothetical protein
LHLEAEDEAEIPDEVAAVCRNAEYGIRIMSFRSTHAWVLAGARGCVSALKRIAEAYHAHGIAAVMSR